MTTYNKQTIENCKKYILAKFEDSPVDNLSPLESLKVQIKALHVKGESVYQTAVQFILGGAYACDCYTAQDDLIKLLNQDETFKKKYSPSKSWDLYVHKLAQTIEKLCK